MTLVFDRVEQQGIAKKTILELSLNIFPGVTAVMGANGSGKTTMLKTAAGLLYPAGGEVYFENMSLYPRAKTLNIAYIPQEKTLFLCLKVKDALVYLATLRGVLQKEAIMALEEWGLTEASSKPLNQLSPGERRRFFIAQSFLQDSELCVFDEATAGLDFFYRQQLLNRINELNSRRATVLIATHLSEDVASIADTLVVLSEGRLKYYGPPKPYIESID